MKHLFFAAVLSVASTSANAATLTFTWNGSGPLNAASSVVFDVAGEDISHFAYAGEYTGTIGGDWLPNITTNSLNARLLSWNHERPVYMHSWHGRFSFAVKDGRGIVSVAIKGGDHETHMLTNSILVDHNQGDSFSTDYGRWDVSHVSAVPIPASLALLPVALLMLGGIGRFKRA